MPYCPECGAEIQNTDTEYCVECGVSLPQSEITGSATRAAGSNPQRGTANTQTNRSNEGYSEPRAGGRQPPRTASSQKKWSDEYSTGVWIASVIFGLLTFPIGLAIPAYFFVKANGDSPTDHSGLEIWTVILWGILGIAAVEFGGKKGAKVLWGILVGIFVLAILVFTLLVVG